MNYEEERKRIDKHLDEISSLIGELTISFNSLEWSLNEALYALVSDSDGNFARIIVGEKTISQRADLFLGLINYLFSGMGLDEPRKKINIIIPEIKEAIKRRNHIIHAEWIDLDIMNNKVLIKKQFRKGEFRKIFKSVRVKDIQADIDFINDVSERFENLLEDISEKHQISFNPAYHED